MISFFLTTLLVVDPLAAASDSSDTWFVSDRPPKNVGADFEISHLESPTTYTTWIELLHRPTAIQVSQDAIWFVDHGAGIGLYQTNLKEMQGSKPVATLQDFITTDLIPIDLEIIGNRKIVVCQNEVLQCISFDGDLRTMLPPLDSQTAMTTVQDDRLIAASQEGNVVTSWALHEEGWQKISQYQVHGILSDFMMKEDWPVLIMSLKDKIQIIGLQRDRQVPIATLRIPRGRWRVLQSELGLMLLSVQRNGTVMNQIISWPSGNFAKPMEITNVKRGLPISELLYSLITPLFLCFLLILLIRRKK